MLQIERLSSGYGELRALDELSIEVAPGEIVALLGQNGAGKSTAAHAAAGILPAWSGRVRLGADDLSTLPAHARARKGLGCVLEGKRIFHGQAVAQNLLVCRPRKGGAAFDPRETFPALAGHWTRRAGSLSGGQQQMLAVAQALSMGPRALILDEPSAGLAPAIVRDLFDVLRSLADQGLAILIVEQLLQETLRIADRAVVLRLGRTVGAWEPGPGSLAEIRDALRMIDEPPTTGVAP